jgi:glycosyltransferase involved in cell wall biosynthesis
MHAAAAGLPVMVCGGVHGLEDLVVDGRNGWVVARDPGAIATWLMRALDDRATLPAMGRAAAESMRPYAPEGFQARWLQTVAAVLRGDDPRATPEAA